MRQNILLVSIGLLAGAGFYAAKPAVKGNVRQPESVAAPAPSTTTVPAGTRLRVRMLQTLDTHRSRPGDRFSAVLDEPLVSGDRVVIPKGTTFHGRITEARPSGRFKGRAVMALRLDSFTLKGRTYAVRSSRSTRTSASHKKRNWLWIGGGSGTGATIGAAAGGGPGALIGAGAGAAAGTVGAVITGKKNVRYPVESVVTFSLTEPVQIG